VSDAVHDGRYHSEAIAGFTSTSRFSSTSFSAPTPGIRRRSRCANSRARPGRPQGQAHVQRAHRKDAGGTGSDPAPSAASTVRVISERAMKPTRPRLGNHAVGDDRQQNSQRAAVCFCLCGSGNCDVIGWLDSRTATFRCADCEREAAVEGFTIGRTSLPPSLLEEAFQDRAGALG